MNKNILAIATALLVSTSLSSVAQAGCDGWYLGARGGIVNHNLGDPEDGVTSNDRIEIDDNAYMVSGALGYRYGYIRAEIEYTWRDTSEEEKKSILGSTLITTGNEFQTKSYMANFYVDLSPYTMFTPYIMGGLGMTNVNYVFKNSSAANVEYEEDNFTWALGGGLSAQLTNRWNLDVGYRYLDMGKIKDANVEAHEVYGGIRYTF